MPTRELANQILATVEPLAAAAGLRGSAIPAGWPEPFRTKALAGRTVRPRVEELSADRLELTLTADPATEARSLEVAGRGRWATEVDALVTYLAGG